MKKEFLKIFTAATLLVVVTGCKDKAKEAETTEAQEVETVELADAKYMVNAGESMIEWKGFKPTGTHNGTIKIESGVLNTEEDKLVGGTILIDMKTIEVLDLEGDKKTSLENHLKGTVEGKENDFFNVNQHPTAAFTITGFDHVENGMSKLSGNLKMKGKENNISIPVKVSMNGDMMTIESEKFSVDRSKWDVNYGSKSVFDNLGDNFINDDFELKLMVKAEKKV